MNNEYKQFLNTTDTLATDTPCGSYYNRYVIISNYRRDY